LAQLWLTIRGADPFCFSVIVIITLLQYVIRAWRWSVFLEPIKKTSFFSRFSATIIGFAANFLLPVRLGEFVRADTLGRIEEIRRSATFGTIVVERLFDGLTILIVLLLALLLTTFPENWAPLEASIRGGGLLIFLLSILAIVLIIGLKQKPQPFLSLLDRLLSFLPERLRSRAVDLTWHFSQGIVLARSLSRISLAVSYSLILWFSYLCQIEFVERTLGLALPVTAPFVILTMCSLGVAIPSAPGFIGTFHLPVQFAFVFFGVSSEKALSAAIIWHAASFFTTIAAGGILSAVVFLRLRKSSVAEKDT
jgi:uncharacterized protein (TIRG00374 family)